MKYQSLFAWDYEIKYHQSAELTHIVVNVKFSFEVYYDVYKASKELKWFRQSQNIAKVAKKTRETSKNIFNA